MTADKIRDKELKAERDNSKLNMFFFGLNPREPKISKFEKFANGVAKFPMVWELLEPLTGNAGIAGK